MNTQDHEQFTSGSSDEEPLTLKELHACLSQAGVEISYKSLSDLTGTDDVALQLGAAGGRNRLAFPPSAVENVQGFLGYYRRRKGTRPHASRMMRGYLKSLQPDEEKDKDLSEELMGGDGELANQRQDERINVVIAQLASVMADFIEAVKEVSPVREDSTLTRSQAAALLSCSPSRVNRFVAPLRRGVYRRSDVMRYIATGQRQG